MKKIKALIVIDNLHTGGVASSLYNYLHFVHDKMDCSLLVFNEESIDNEKIPSDVKVYATARILHILGKNRAEMSKESKLLSLFRTFLFVISRYINGECARFLLWPFVKRIAGFDLALSYAQDDSWTSLSKGCNDFVIKKVDAPYKAAMVHCDYMNFGGYSPKQVKLLSKMDSIICVSESCKISFSRCFPSLANKVIACENFTNVSDIRNKAANAFEYSNQKINFVTVCRLSVVKGLSRTVEALRKLKEEGYMNFTWTIVGDGPERNNLLRQISEFNLTSCIEMVGNKENPYPYIKNASCFLLPSLHEAAPMVFGEASSLGVPVLTTETCSAIELVQSRGIGYVVDNSIEGIYKGIKMILDDPVHIKHLSIEETDINSNATSQFNQFIELINR